MKTNSSCSNKRHNLWIFATLVFALPVTAKAFQFGNETGTLKGSFDTTVSLGASWRAEDRDKDLIGISNGGNARSVNADDGNLNFDKRDLISVLAKATHDFELKYKNYGVFLRGTYFFDDVYDDLRRDGINGFGSQGKDQLASEAELLDAYVHGTFDLGGRRLNARIGQQVVSWGESTFIPNGINIINAVDVTRLRKPGSELREAFLPSPMLWLSQEVSDTITVEGFYLANFDEVRIDPRGSFFSTNDFISEDGDKAFAGFGRRWDQHFPLSPPAGPTAATAQLWLTRASDRSASDSGQYGLAARAFLPQLNSTELGFFYAKYHSRTPIFSGIAGALTATITPAAGFTGTARYFSEYPEDIRVYGISFNTDGPVGIALQGEYSYRPNQPLQVAGIEVLLATVSPQFGGPATANQITGTTALPVGAEVSGYRRVNMHQAQVTATKAFGPTFGGDQLVLLGEVGYNRFNLTEGLDFNGPASQLPAPGSSTALSAGSAQPGGDGYVTANSWGYRLVSALTFNDAIGAINLIPRVAFAHDVRGVGLNFNEGVRAATVGMGMSYKENLQANVSYTSFFGGKTFKGTDPGAIPPGQSPNFAFSSNPLKDRDFYSVDVSYSF